MHTPEQPIRHHTGPWQRRRMFSLLLMLIATLLAWLSVRYQWTADWTHNQHHTLSKISYQAIQLLSSPLTITAYAGESSSLREQISHLVSRYQRASTQVQLRFVDPYLVPAEVRKLGIQLDGELHLHYQQRTALVRELSEQHLTSAVLKLLRPQNRRIFFLNGHGERSPVNTANHDLSDWAEQLESRGLQIETLSLLRDSNMLTTSDVLVIASPQISLLATEVATIRDQVQRGGHLLWLIEPEEDWHGLEPLADDLGLTVLPGTLVDPGNRMFGIDQPTIVPIAHYGNHPAVETVRHFLSLLPTAAGLLVFPPSDDWTMVPLMSTDPAAWSETGTGSSVSYTNNEDIAGPLDVAVALARTLIQDGKKVEQRIIIAGDGDFLSNRYVQNVANLDLGLQLMDWLAGDTALLSLPPRPALGNTLNLSPATAIAIGSIFLILLPLLLFSIGLLVWHHRHRA